MSITKPGAFGLVAGAVLFAAGLLAAAAIVTAAALWLSAPPLLGLGALACAAMPLAAYLTRRALAPLDALTRFAEQAVERGEATPMELAARGEFAPLANAFNHMLARAETSARRMQAVAYIDPVTRLPNHDRFVREVDAFMWRAKATGETGAVLVFELQRLGKLIQALEPEAARELICLAAERFASAVRAANQLVRPHRSMFAIAARIGASDFAVFAPGLAAPTEAARFAQHINSALNRPCEWRGGQYLLAPCCGVALAPRDGPDGAALIRRARMALGSAQNAPARLKVFSPSLDRQATARLTLEREMRGALARDEFRAYFQPKIDLATGRIGGCEALARWQRPDRTLVGPGRFIPVAEESGLIGELSDAILREACWKAAAWARAEMPVKVAVNVSALQFRDDNFADNVLRIVRQAGLAPRLLELEITESVAMEDIGRALRQTTPLRAAGVRLAIDDFGCGHSSLAALSKLPFDVIKIDQHFIRGLENGDAQAAAIVEMILSLARTLTLEVVAEGVERREQAEFVAARGCDWAQGFLYGAAVSASEFTAMLRKQAGPAARAEAAA